MNSLAIAARSNQGRWENLRGPGQNICSDCFNRVFDSSIRVYRSVLGHTVLARRLILHLNHQ